MMDKWLFGEEPLIEDSRDNGDEDPRTRDTVVNANCVPVGEEFPTGLFGCLKRPKASLLAFCCPCISEFLVARKFGFAVVGTVTCFLTASILILNLVYAKVEYDLEKGLAVQKMCYIYDIPGRCEYVKKLKILSNVALSMFFIVLSLYGIRLCLYCYTRNNIRRRLAHRGRNNPDFFDLPDYCAVFWCHLCVLAQNAIASESFGKENNTTYRRFTDNIGQKVDV